MVMVCRHLSAVDSATKLHTGRVQPARERTFAKGRSGSRWKFLERFRSEPTCDVRLIAELLKEVRADVARGYTLEDLQVDARYGFLSKAYLDTSKMEDQGWGFEVTEFEVLSERRNGN